MPVPPTKKTGPPGAQASGAGSHWPCIHTHTPTPEPRRSHGKSDTDHLCEHTHTQTRMRAPWATRRDKRLVTGLVLGIACCTLSPLGSTGRLDPPLCKHALNASESEGFKGRTPAVSPMCVGYDAGARHLYPEALDVVVHCQELDGRTVAQHRTTRTHERRARKAHEVVDRCTEPHTLTLSVGERARCVDRLTRRR